MALTADYGKRQTPSSGRARPIGQICMVIADADLLDEVRGHVESKDLELAVG
ncbi:hypothetical protein OHS59_12180 [Streptomyces sp. NBC_00414]|uniref:hypothetical protein n=1 Tax=Streptomyces sp. NBC_00414 TaxID=2975739 RepID=UPI002E1E31BD